MIAARPLRLSLTLFMLILLATPLKAHDPKRSEKTAQVEVVYTADHWTLVSGGLDPGSTYLDNLDLTVAADLDRLVGWRGASLFLYGLYNGPKAFSSRVGDAQIGSNIETGIRAARLYEAWIEQALSHRASVKVGLYDLNSEFDVLDTSGLFVSSPHGIGTDISQSGENGPSIFPVTSLAGRARIDVAKNWTVRVAALDGVPGDPHRPSRTAVRLGNGDGALLIGEVERRAGASKLLLGFWRYTGDFARWDGSEPTGNEGVYIRGERRAWREPLDSEQGLGVFARLGLADGRVNSFRGFASAGAVYDGLLEGREDDQIGLAVAAAFTSDDYRRVQRADSAEIIFDLTYRAAVLDWFTLQPNLQYFVNPGADPFVRNGLAIGLRVEFRLLKF